MAFRRRLEPSRLQRAVVVVDLAWRDLPAEHRLLLDNIGARHRDVVDRPLGEYASELYVSAGHPALILGRRNELDRALGVWIEPLRTVIIDAGHPALEGLDDASYESMLVRAAWHEWGHALSSARATGDDISAGDRLLALAPSGIGEFVRGGGYRSSEVAHEVVAEIYALLMARRRRGEIGVPPWLNEEILELVRRVTGWTE